MAAAFKYQNAFAEQIIRAGRALLTVAVDHLGGDFEVGQGEACVLLPSVAFYQTGGSQYRSVGLVEAGEQLVEVVGGFDFQLKTQIIGKALHQPVFETGLAVTVLEISGRAVAGDHPQYTLRLNALECAGFFSTAAEHQEDSDHRQPAGAAHTERRLGKHWRSIRKAWGAPYLDSGLLLC